MPTPPYAAVPGPHACMGRGLPSRPHLPITADGAVTAVTADGAFVLVGTGWCAGGRVHKEGNGDHLPTWYKNGVTRERCRDLCASLTECVAFDNRREDMAMFCNLRLANKLVACHSPKRPAGFEAWPGGCSADCAMDIYVDSMNVPITGSCWKKRGEYEIHMQCLHQNTQALKHTLEL